jgi:hypothetical protein
MGAVANQLSSSTDAVATVLAPLCPLLSTKNDKTDTHGQAFIRAKKSFTVAPTLALQLTYAQMPAGLDWGSSSNSSQVMAHGPSFRQGHVSLQTRSRDELELLVAVAKCKM